MEKDLITIVVPVYNVEKYLERCVDSLLKQTYENLEIILVNDGSKDSSGELCDKLALRDVRIKVIHKLNGGLSDARNCGLDAMSGKWVSFIDSDDYVSPDYVKRMYTMCIENDTQISSCQFIRTSVDDYSFAPFADDIKIISGTEAIKSIYGEMNGEITIVSTCKLYSAKLFDGYRFKKGIIHEDEELVWKLLYGAEKIAVTQAQLYAYYMSANSIMRGGFDERSTVMLDILKERAIRFQEDKAVEIYDLTLKTRCYILNMLYCKYKKYMPDKNAAAESAREEFKEIYKQVKNSKYISAKSKLSLVMMNFIPTVYGRIKGY